MKPDLYDIDLTALLYFGANGELRHKVGDQQDQLAAIKKPNIYKPVVIIYGHEYDEACVYIELYEQEYPQWASH